ncbi:hypothetical protein HPB47_015513 [Ixodes persulcatus]|uniref:Uncharacterized protein n=1 Tax=Ixodes persulcatus TaxID=34615 RepID=A0AC60R0F7_IXOPE|nr:hypothetical protein HPB47_015513 [Ixodes persulcatus]
MSQITDSDDSTDQATRSPKKRSPQKKHKRNKKSPRKPTTQQLTELVNTCFNTSAKVFNLIQRVKRYPWLYNKHSGNYKTNTMRNNALTSIAKEIGLDPAYGGTGPVLRQRAALVSPVRMLLTALLLGASGPLVAGWAVTVGLG